MRISIYFMSGTGNTRRAAELLQLQLRALGHSCEVVDWAQKDFAGWDSAEAFGFAAPVHSYREPTPFKQKVKALPRIPKETRKPVFLIAGCAGEEGNLLARVGMWIRQKGRQLWELTCTSHLSMS